MMLMILKYRRYNLCEATDFYACRDKGNEYEKEDFDIDFISFNKDKRIIKVVSTLAYEEFSKQIEKYKPLIIDEIPIDFEELFIIEVESKGYLK